jgi:AraC-like DNA-binding protein
MIDPRVDIWLFPILTTVCMIYLVYIVLYHSTSVYLNRLPEVTVAAAGTVSKSESATSAMDEEQMKRISDKAVDYLQTSKSYLDPELTLSMLSAATKIAQRSLSAAINGYLHKNFFDLVNEMRVGEAKRILRELSGELTTESIYPQCGFSSARSFFRAFQKFEGASPDNWRKSHREF